jgi:hypothetical protein
MRQRGTSVRSASGRRAALAAVTSAVLAAALLGGCSKGDDAGSGEPVATVPAATASSIPATTTTTTPPATTPATTSTPTPKPTKTRWPRALAAPKEDEPAWAVYLAVAHSMSDPSMKAAQEAVATAGPGYGAVVGDLACDRGSMKALGLDLHDYWTGAVLYFSSKTDAEDFANSYLVEGGTVVGVAKIELGCLD